MKVVEPLVLKLYTCGRSLRSESSLRQLKSTLRDRFGIECVLSYVDLATQPELAENCRILATPMLVREAPSPVRRIIGDFQDIERVVRGLGLTGD